MLSQIAKLETIAREALTAFVANKSCQAANVPAVIDNGLSDVEQAALLHGSVIRAQLGGATKFWLVPRDATYKSSGTGMAKLGVTDKWGGQATDKPLDKLGTIDAVMLGVLTLPGAGGAVDPRSQHMLGQLPATMAPGTQGASVNQVALTVANSTRLKTLDEVSAALGVAWQPWHGEKGGLESFPAGPGLPIASMLSTTKLKAQDLLQGLQAGGGAQMAEVALKSISLIADDGTVSADELGAFLAALAGMPEAADFFAVGLAVQGEATASGKVAKTMGDKACDVLAGVAALVDVHVIKAVRDQLAPLTALGMDTGGGQVGAALASEVHRLAALLAADENARLAADRATAQTAAGVGGAGGAGGTTGGGGAAGAGGADANAGLSQQEQIAADQAQARALLSKLGLGDDVMTAVQDGMDKAASASRGLAGSRLRSLVPDLCGHLSEAEVLKLVASAVSASASDLAAELAQARGIATPPSSIFAAGDAAGVEAAVADWKAIIDKSGLTFESPPDDWAGSAQRVRNVLDAYRRAGAPSAEVAGATKTAADGGVGDDNRSGLLKTVQLASKDGKSFAVAGEMITPLSTLAFAREQAVATKGATSVQEVRRLCDLPNEVGEACRAFIFSNGTVAGSAPKGVCATVVDARSWLLADIQDQIEQVVTEKRLPEVHDKVEALAGSVLCVRALKDGKLDEATSLYCLAVYLLGGTPPADELGTDNDEVGRGTWGTRVGQQSAIDIPIAMYHLARLIAMAHGRAGGGAYRASKQASTATAHTFDGLGLVGVARHACGSLNPVKVDEAFKDLFMRAQNLAMRVRTRKGSPPVDWVALIAEVVARKVIPLVNELRAENAVDRRSAQLGRPKSPRRGEEEDEASTEGKTKLAKKGGPNDFVEAKKKKKEEAKKAKAAVAEAAKVAAANNDANSTRAAALLATKPQGGGGATLLPGSITCLASKTEHNGAVEVLSGLYTTRNPDRRQRELQPCAFVAIRKGPSAESDEVCLSGGKAGGCAQCDGWKATPVADRVPFLASEVAAVKAACTSKVQAIFA